MRDIQVELTCYRGERYETGRRRLSNTHQRLLELTPTESPELQAAWQAAAEAAAAQTPRAVEGVPEQFLVLVTCRDEKHQVELLGRFHGEGLECRALLG